MKTVLMIGGGVQQVRAVELARKLGYRVYVTDRYADAPCREAADKLFVVDGRDTEGQVALALRLREQGELDGVFTLTELVTGVSVVARAAGLPGASLESAVRCQEKSLSKIRWLSDGVSTPEGRTASTPGQLRESVEAMGLPCIVKPVTGFGGRGVTPLRTRKEAEDFLRRVKEEAAEMAAGDESGRQRWVVEELCEGSHHDVNGLFDAEGRFHSLGVVDRFFLDNHPVEKEIRWPSALSAGRQRALYELLEEGARSLGVEAGPVKADAVLHEGTFKLLEAAPRLHGPKNSIYLLEYGGLHPLDATLRMLTGGELPPGMDPLPETPDSSLPGLSDPTHVICRAILPEPGRIAAVEGVEEALAREGIPEILMFKGAGDSVPAYRNATHVPGYIFAAGPDFDTCEARMERAQQTVDVQIET